MAAALFVGGAELAWLVTGRSDDDGSVELADEYEFAAQRRAALGYVSDAFEEARLDGIEPDFLTQAALFAAFKAMVETYGEDAVAEFAERLPARIREFEFSVRLTTQ